MGAQHLSFGRQLFFCSYVYSRGKSAWKVRHYFIGRTSNATTAALVAEFVVCAVNREASKLARACYGGNGFVRSLGWGAASRIRERVQQLKADEQQLVEPETSTSTTIGDVTQQALVLASVYATEEKANAAFIAACYPKLGVGRTAKHADHMGAFGAGIVYGDAVSGAPVEMNMSAATSETAPTLEDMQREAREILDRLAREAQADAAARHAPLEALPPDDGVPFFDPTTTNDAPANGAAHGQLESVICNERNAPPRNRTLVWADLEGKEPPAREWIVPHWIPAAHPTLLTGRAGVGKTLLAQHLGTALAYGVKYLEPYPRVACSCGLAKMTSRSCGAASYTSARTSGTRSRRSQSGSSCTATPVWTSRSRRRPSDASSRPRSSANYVSKSATTVRGS